MPSNNRNTASSSFTFSSSTTTSFSGPSGTHSKHTYSDPSGTTVTEASQRPGERPIVETTEYPRGHAGGGQLGSTSGGNAARQIEDVSDEPEAEEERK